MAGQALRNGAKQGTRPIGALQPDAGGVKRASMKRALASAEVGRLDITPEWDDIQVCIITC